MEKTQTSRIQWVAGHESDIYETSRILDVLEQEHTDSLLVSPLGRSLTFSEDRVCATETSMVLKPEDWDGMMHKVDLVFSSSVGGVCVEPP